MKSNVLTLEPEIKLELKEKVVSEPTYNKVKKVSEIFDKTKKFLKNYIIYFILVLSLSFTLKLFLDPPSTKVYLKDKQTPCTSCESILHDEYVYEIDGLTYCTKCSEQILVSRHDKPITDNTLFTVRLIMGFICFIWLSVCLVNICHRLGMDSIIEVDFY